MTAFVWNLLNRGGNKYFLKNLIFIVIYPIQCNWLISQHIVMVP